MANLDHPWSADNSLCARLLMNKQEVPVIVGLKIMTLDDQRILRIGVEDFSAVAVFIIVDCIEGTAGNLQVALGYHVLCDQ